MSLNEFLDKKIVVKQIKSGNKFTKKQAGNLVGLGLSGINSESVLVANKSVLGMIQKVNHIVEIKLA